MTDTTERDALIAWLYVDQRRSLTGVALDTTESENLADGFLSWMRENGYEKREPFSGPSCPRCGRKMSLSDEACDEHPQREPIAGVADLVAEAEQVQAELAMNTLGERLPVIDALVAALREPVVVDDAAEWEYGVRLVGNEEPYTGISRDLDWVLDHALAVNDDEIVKRRPAGPWAALTPDGQEKD